MEPGTVWQRWQEHAERTPEREAIVHLAVGAEPHRWRWGELLSAAGRVTRWLAEAGVRPGQVCALILRHHRDFYPVYLGISGLGALPAVLAYPNSRLHPDKFREGLAGMALRSGLDHLVTEHELDPVLGPLVSAPGSTVRRVLHPLEALADARVADVPAHPAGDGSEPCLLQHSSGTTGLQKPVVLSHRAVLEHAERYGRVIGLGAQDRVVSWLPLYHDMGLIAAFYLPLLHGAPTIQLSPIEWVASPVLLLQALSGELGTLSWLPNFAYNLMADRVRDEHLDGVRLDGVRLLVNCSEPVRAESHEKFHRRFAPYGLRREALGACYAMAETTFAVTQTAPGEMARTLLVDRAQLAQGRVVPAADASSARACVSSGRLVPGCAVRVLDEDRRDVPEGRVGEIAISSVSMFGGYRNYPEKTAAALQDGWYHSGDLGFVHDRECYVIGRKKDVIILAGNNVYPEEVEDAVSCVPGVLPGRVVAFGADDARGGTEVLCVVAETEATDEPERKALRLAVMKAGMAIDVTIARVYLVPPRWMIKSSSGKPSRAANRERVTEDLARR